jgi:hypothetical protein
MNAILAVSKDDLERKLLYGTGLVSSVNVNETLRRGRDIGERGIYGNAKAVRSSRTMFRIPVR